MKNKKAQQTIGNLPSSIIAIVVAIIILVLGIVIIQEIRDVDMVANSESASYDNETLTTVTSAGETLTCGTYPNPTCTLVLVSNNSGGETIIAANYTQSNCIIYNTTSAYGGEDWNVTYSCTYGGVSYTSANASMVGVGTFSDFIPIIIIALAASIVIGLILLGFLRRGQQR